MGNDLKRIPTKSLSTQSRDYGFIQEVTKVSDGEGGFVPSWANAHVNPHSMALLTLTAKQVFEYKSINVEASHLIKIRGEIEVSELNRVVITQNNKERIFEILDVEDIQERGIVKWIFTKERRA